MVSSDSFRDNLHREGLENKDRMLLVLDNNTSTPKTVSEIRQTAVSSGLRSAKKWNVSTTLARTNGLAIRVEGGWLITQRGREYLRLQNLISGNLKPAKAVSADLRQYLSTVADPGTKNFIEEAIVCLETELLRAAVVLSWVGSVGILYEQVVQNHLNVFNAEAKRRDSKWRDASTPDDLARMKEHEFLNVLEAISVIGKNVKQELQNNCLKLRNACGHPNSLQIGQNRVAAHIEILVQNVFSKF